MEKTTIYFEDFQNSLKNNTLTELFDKGFATELIFQHRKDLDKRSGYFDFMRNYMLKHVSEKLNIKGDDIANEFFVVENDNFYYKNKLVLSCLRKESDTNVIYHYVYYKLNN